MLLKMLFEKILIYYDHKVEKKTMKNENFDLQIYTHTMMMICFF